MLVSYLPFEDHHNTQNKHGFCSRGTYLKWRSSYRLLNPCQIGASVFLYVMYKITATSGQNGDVTFGSSCRVPRYLNFQNRRTVMEKYSRRINILDEPMSDSIMLQSLLIERSNQKPCLNLSKQNESRHQHQWNWQVRCHEMLNPKLLQDYRKQHLIFQIKKNDENDTFMTKIWPHLESHLYNH